MSAGSLLSIVGRGPTRGRPSQSAPRWGSVRSGRNFGRSSVFELACLDHLGLLGCGVRKLRDEVQPQGCLDPKHETNAVYHTIRLKSSDGRSNAPQTEGHTKRHIIPAKCICQLNSARNPARMGVQRTYTTCGIGFLRMRQDVVPCSEAIYSRFASLRPRLGYTGVKCVFE